MKVPVVVVVQVGGPLSLLQQNKFSQCLSTFIIHVYINIYIYIILYIPVVPHKAVAEVSKTGNL